VTAQLSANEPFGGVWYQAFLSVFSPGFWNMRCITLARVTFLISSSVTGGILRNMEYEFPTALAGLKMAYFRFTMTPPWKDCLSSPPMPHLLSTRTKADHQDPALAGARNRI
jgi:hypothetical protein